MPSRRSVRINEGTLSLGDVFHLMIDDKAVLGSYKVVDISSTKRFRGRKLDNRKQEVVVSWRWKSKTWLPQGLTRLSPIRVVHFLPLLSV